MNRLGAHHRKRKRIHSLQMLLSGLLHRRLFSNVKTFVFFVGYPRSGHSLLGAQMTAHQNMVISHELHALRYVQFGYGRHQLFETIRRRDKWFVGLDCQNGKYQYRVPNSWQGCHDEITVMGDKKGAGSTQCLIRHPEVLDQLRYFINVKVRMIHVTRNPFDTISRIFLKSDLSLPKVIERYFKMCRGNAALIKANPSDVLTVRHESNLRDPRSSLAEICRFVGVETTSGFLDNCASIVNQSPGRARDEINWEPELIQQVTKLMSEFEFLSDYQFEH